MKNSPSEERIFIEKMVSKPGLSAEIPVVINPGKAEVVLDCGLTPPRIDLRKAVEVRPRNINE